MSQVIAPFEKPTLTTPSRHSRLSMNPSQPDFMSHVIAAREQYGIPEVQMAAHASDFVVAGSETTATALSCITYYLQKRPDILAKLRGEVRSAFSSYAEIDSESTLHLKYLKAVCLEAMRVYPPLPFPLPRIVPDGGAEVDSHYLPGGTIVSTNPFAASMSSANFVDPWDFKPERWLGENTEDNLEASQPFSHGPRSCLGRRCVSSLLFPCFLPHFDLIFIYADQRDTFSAALGGWRCAPSWPKCTFSTIWSCSNQIWTGISSRRCTRCGRNQS